MDARILRVPSERAAWQAQTSPSSVAHVGGPMAAAAIAGGVGWTLPRSGSNVALQPTVVAEALPLSVSLVPELECH
jgi:hypothetical protein